MTGRARLIALGLILLARPVAAQSPPQQPSEPRLLPPSVGGYSVPATTPRTASPAASPADVQTGEPQEGPSAGPKPDPSVVLPHREVRFKLDPGTLLLRQLPTGWQITAGSVPFRDFGTDGRAAQDAYGHVRGLRPTEWCVIGGTRPVVEYGLTNGEAPKWSTSPRAQFPIDLKTVRAEPVRGAWVLADDANILLNFGPDRAGAEQAAAVAKRYGFNRVGLVGQPVPQMAFFFAMNAPVTAKPATADALAAIVRASQEQNLTRTAVDVPGVGLVGERLTFDRNKLDVRKDRADWVLASGPDVLARFGYSELAARDALRVVVDGRFTEFCKVGGLTFLLTNGQPPTRVPFAAQGARFEPRLLAAREVGGVWGVYEGTGRLLYPAESVAEAETMVKVIRAYGFDQTCLVGSPKAGLRFLAKTGR